MNNTGFKKRKSSKPFPQTSMSELTKRVRERFNSEYKVTQDWYKIKVINDIIFNEKTLLVANFKEYLIFDDNSEFLKRFSKINIDSFVLLRLREN
jgi:hypothetical protein